MALMTQVGVEFIARNRATGTIGTMQASLTGLGRTMLQMAGLGGGVYALQRGFIGMIRSASDAQETLSKFNVVFRDQAPSAARWADDFGNKVGRSTQDVQKWMASLQDLFVPLGFARDKAFELSKSLTELAVDVASFNNQADADTIRDFTSALVGNHEAVRKYGIIITEASLKQEALAKGITKNYAELTNLEKVSLRMGIIQRSSTDAQGDAIRTADSYANQVKRLSANWTEFQTNLGQVVIPTLEKLIALMNKAVEQPEKLKSGWSNLGWTMQNTVLNSAMADPAHRAQWELARRQYDREMGKWIQTGPGGRYRVPADMERWQQLLEHFESGALTNLPQGRIQFGPGRLKFFEDMTRRAAESQQVAGAPSALELTVEQKRSIIEGARQTMEAVRHQDYLTRMERMESLRIYQKENADTLSQVAEANRILDEEIRSIERSRLDAMKVYRAELREDAQNINLYLAEKFAEAARSMESALSDSFQSMMRDGATWRDAMVQFLTDVRNAFIKMAADIMARAAAKAVIEPLMSGLLGAIGGGIRGPAGGVSPNYSPNFSTTTSNAGVAPVIASVGHRGGVLGADSFPARLVSPALFANAPKFHDLGPDEFAIIGQRGEEISRPGRGRTMQAPNIIINNNTGQSFQTDGPPQFDGERWVVGIVAQNIKQGGSLKRMLKS